MTNAESRLEKLVTSNPQKYSRKDIALNLGVRLDYISVLLNRRPDLVPYVKSLRPTDEQARKEYSEIQQLLEEEDKGELTRKQICEILDLERERVNNFFTKLPEYKEYLKPSKRKTDWVIEYLDELEGTITQNELTKELGVSPTSVSNALKERPDLKSKIRRVVSTEEQRNKRRNRVINLINENPYKYTRREIASILGEKYEYVQVTIKNHEDLGYKVLTDTKGKRVRDNSIAHNLKKYLDDHPNEKSVRELSEHFNVATSYIYRLIGEDPNLKSKVKQSSSISKMVVDLLEENPDKYSFQEIKDIYNITDGHLSSILTRNPDIKQLVRSKRRKTTQDVLDFLDQNPGKYTHREVSNLVEVNPSHLSTILTQNSSYRDKLVKEPREREQWILDMIELIQNNPHKYTVKKLQELTGVSDTLIYSLVNREPKLKELVIKSKGIGNRNRTILKYIDRHHKDSYTVRELQRAILDVGYLDVLRFARTNVIGYEKVKLNLQNKKDIEERNIEPSNNVLIADLLVNNPNKYTYSEIVRELNLDKNAPYHLISKYPHYKELIATKKRKNLDGIREELTELIKSNPNKYTRTELAETYDMQYSQMYNELSNLGLLHLTKTLKKKIDKEKIVDDILEHKHEYTYKDISDKYGISLSSTYLIVKENHLTVYIK